MLELLGPENVKPSTFTSNYGQQQSYRPRGPSASLPQWGGRAPHSAPSMPYDYQQQRGGPYPSQSQHYPPPYGGYPPQGPPRGNYNSGWEQRPPPMQQGPPNHTGGYDYYGGQGVPPARPSMIQHSMPSHPPPNYNYGQQQQQYPYSQTTQPPQQQTYPSNAPYQAPTMPAQQSYPYAPVAAAAQPVAGYGQLGPTAYPQAYGQYPQQTQQGGYATQPPASGASYGYQAQVADPSAYAAPQAYSSAPQAAAYAQPQTGQAGYEQAGGYPAPTAAPVSGAPQAAGGYPQPTGGYPQQYDASQMYGQSG